MARRRTGVNVETEVLVRSRRRCAICFGLNRDTSIKAGQIAHLDQNNQNSKLDNLCFICLVHHDEFDSKSSQRKNLTISEVKHFRSELYASNEKILSLPVHFGEITLPPADPYAGQFTRIGTTDDSAEIEITPLSNNLDDKARYFAAGLSIPGFDRDYGMKTGELEIVLTMHEKGKFVATGLLPGFSDEIYSISCEFSGDKLVVVEQNTFGLYGAGVTFDGTYLRGVS